MTGNHKERAHSIFSASGSERWLNCAYSVEGVENIPELPDSFWSKEGTLAHEVLEAKLLNLPVPEDFDVTREMIGHVDKMVAKVLSVKEAFGGKMFVEKRVYAMFIDEEMFGTLDIYIAADNRTLHILDFKYGAGHVVKAEKNTQLIQYALSVAESYGWDLAFDNVVLWVLQPRVSEKGFDRWSLTMKELKDYWLPIFEKGVARVRKGGNKPFPGSWCHWCPKKFICPAKAEKRVTEITNMFSQLITYGGTNGNKEKTEKTGQQTGAKASRKKGEGGQGKKKGEEKSFKEKVRAARRLGRNEFAERDVFDQFD